VNTFQRVTTTVLLIAAWMVPAHAQLVTKVGTTAAKFLSIPVGARALGMGGAFVALADDPSALYWNPAGAARMYQSEVLFSHMNWIADVNFNYAAIVLPLEGAGTAGINFTSLTMEEMERTTEAQPDGTGQFFSVGSFAVGVSYARNLTDWFSIGGTVKYVNEYIWNSKSKAFGFDLGTLFTTPFEGIKFGAAIANYGERLQMSGDDLLVQKDVSSNAGNDPNVNADLRTDQYDLPLVVRIGLAYEPLSSEDQHLVLAVDAAHPNDNSESINLGGEYSLFQKMLSLRGGYRALGQRDSEEQFTLGGGLRYDFGNNLIVKVDYAYEKFGRLSNVQKFSVGLMW